MDGSIVVDRGDGWIDTCIHIRIHTYIYKYTNGGVHRKIDTD